jgi:hypothetical protein
MKKLLGAGLLVIILAIGCLTILPEAGFAQGAGAGARALERDVNVIGEIAYGEVSGGNRLPTMIGSIIQIFLGILGVVLVLIIVYAGFLWMTSGGSDEGVKKAKSWMLNAIVGLVIILTAYAITDFVIQKLIQATGAI